MARGSSWWGVGVTEADKNEDEGLPAKNLDKGYFYLYKLYAQFVTQNNGNTAQRLSTTAIQSKCGGIRWPGSSDLLRCPRKCTEIKVNF